jgi:hypothetical protein
MEFYAEENDLLVLNGALVLVDGLAFLLPDVVVLLMASFLLRQRKFVFDIFVAFLPFQMVHIFVAFQRRTVDEGKNEPGKQDSEKQDFHFKEI